LCFVRPNKFCLCTCSKSQNYFRLRMKLLFINLYILCIRVFRFYLTLLLLAQTVQHRMVKHNELKRCLRKSPCRNLWNYPRICLQLIVELGKSSASTGGLLAGIRNYENKYMYWSQVYVMITSICTDHKYVYWLLNGEFGWDPLDKADNFVCVCFAGKGTAPKEHSNQYKWYVRVCILHTCISLLLTAKHFWHLVSEKSLTRSKKVSIRSKIIWKKEKIGNIKQNVNRR
jgi:hypothetical protein